MRKNTKKPAARTVSAKKPAAPKKTAPAKAAPKKAAKGGDSFYISLTFLPRPKTEDGKGGPETKGTWVFQETDEDGDFVDSNTGAVVGSLYIRKSAMKNPPQSLTVEIRGA